MADVRLGGLFVDVRQRNSQFIGATKQNVQALRSQQRNLNRLRGAVRQFNRSVSSAVGGLFSFRSVLLTLGGGGIIGTLIRNQARFGATLVETSAQLGVTVEQLQLLRRAAEGDGVAIESLDNSLRQLTRRLGDAAAGNQEYAEVYERLGIAITDVNGQTRGAFEVLLDSADAISGLSTQADRAAAAYDLFGRQGIALLPILQGGSEALEENLRNFARFGLVTTEQGTALKALEQSYTDLGTVLRTGLATAVAESAGAFATLNRQLAETLPAALNRVVEAVAFLVRNLDTVTNVALTLFGVFAYNRFLPIIRGFAAVAFGAGGARLAVLAFGRALLTVLRRFIIPALIIEGLFIIAQGFMNLIRNVEEFGTSMTDVAIVATADFVTIIVNGLLRLPAAFAAVLTGIGGVLVEGFGQLGNGGLLAALLAGLRGESIAEAFLETFDLGLILQRSLAAAEEVFAGLDPGNVVDPDRILELLGLSPEEVARARAAIEETIDDTWEDIRRLWEEAQDQNPLDPIGIPPILPEDILPDPEDLTLELESAFERLIRDLSAAFSTFASTVIDDFGNIGDAARQLGRDIVEALTQALVVDPLTSGVSGLLSSFLGGISLPGLQAGGPAFAGRPYIVGEAGPELFVPGRSGSVIPNDALGSVNTGATFQFAPVIQPGARAADIDEALARAFPAFEEAIRTSVLSDLGRPSTFSRARSL